MITLYGIPNCDTVKKAQKWLDNQQIPYQFHDFRKDGFNQELLDNFLTQVPWEQLINKRSTSYRNLPDDIKNNLTLATASEAMLNEPTLIKRPVTISSDKASVGFSDKLYTELFQ
ncbi:ArsC family reductase [Colwellia sp. MEBiC06753]